MPVSEFALLATVNPVTPLVASVADAPMPIASFDQHDLPSLSILQPEGWGDIRPAFEFYLRSPFCTPLKWVENGNVVGIGCAIVHGKTAWLGHIIVAEGQRGKGLGRLITQALVDEIKKTRCETIMLLATKLGVPVYKKVGFEAQSSYTFMKGESIRFTQDERVRPFEARYVDAVLSLDIQSVGEDRSKLILPNLSDAMIFIEDSDLVGYYIPSLGDGPIIAKNEEAGHVLMKFRSLQQTKAVIPDQNESAINFLADQGYMIHSHGTRMHFGKPFDWLPTNVYNRIAGNVG